MTDDFVHTSIVILHNYSQKIIIHIDIFNKVWYNYDIKFVTLITSKEKWRCVFIPILKITVAKSNGINTVYRRWTYVK